MPINTGLAPCSEGWKGCHKGVSFFTNSLENLIHPIIICAPSDGSLEINSLENLSKVLHPYDTLDTLLNRVQSQCLSALWHPYTLKTKNLLYARARVSTKLKPEICAEEVVLLNTSGANEWSRLPRYYFRRVLPLGKRRATPICWQSLSAMNRK